MVERQLPKLNISAMFEKLPVLFGCTAYLGTWPNFLICAPESCCSPIVFESCKPIRSDARRNGSASRCAYRAAWYRKACQSLGFLSILIFLKPPGGRFLRVSEW